MQNKETRGADFFSRRARQHCFSLLASSAGVKTFSQDGGSMSSIFSGLPREPTTIQLGMIIFSHPFQGYFTFCVAIKLSWSDTKSL